MRSIDDFQKDGRVYSAIWNTPAHAWVTYIQCGRPPFTIEHKGKAIFDDFGDLVPVEDDLDSSPRWHWILSGHNLEQEDDPDNSAWERWVDYTPPPEHAIERTTAEVQQAEGDFTRILVRGGHHQPYGAPMFDVDLGWENSLRCTRAQLLAIVTAAADVLGLEVKQQKAPRQRREVAACSH